MKIQLITDVTENQKKKIIKFLLDRANSVYQQKKSIENNLELKNKLNKKIKDLNKTAWGGYQKNFLLRQLIGEMEKRKQDTDEMIRVNKIEAGTITEKILEVDDEIAQGVKSIHGLNNTGNCSTYNNTGTSNGLNGEINEIITNDMLENDNSDDGEKTGENNKDFRGFINDNNINF